MEAKVSSKMPLLPPLICRGIAVKDVPGIFGLCHELGYESREMGFGDRIADIIKRPGNAVFVAADAEDAPVGFIHVFIRHAIEIKPCAQIQALVVGKAARRRGAAKLLMGAVEEWARAEGINWLSLYCSSHRDAAHDFYAEQGFDAAITATRFNKNLD
mgnify:FL=1